MNFCFLGSGPHSLATICRLIDLGLTKKLEVFVFDRRSQFDWHPGLLVPNVTMQISFLKDLVSQINPRSQFSFLNFLCETGALTEFTNLSTLYPYRIEFRNYLKWVVERLEKLGVNFIYNTSAVDIDLIADGRCNIKLSSGNTILADFLQISIGGIPNIPTWVQSLLPSRRIVHSKKFVMHVEEIQTIKSRNLRFGIVGGGQSAIEMLNALRQTFSDCSISLIIRRPYLQEYTTNKFSNRIFLPGHIDTFLNLPQNVRDILQDEYKLTNYSGVNSSDLDELYRSTYYGKLLGSERTRIYCSTEVIACEEDRDGCTLFVRDLMSSESSRLEFDCLFLATGYENSLNNTLNRVNFASRSEDIVIDANFQMHVDKSMTRVFCLGHNERTHGIQDVLVSNVAFKASRVCERTAALIN